MGARVRAPRGRPAVAQGQSLRCLEFQRPVQTEVDRKERHRRKRSRGSAARAEILLEDVCAYVLDLRGGQPFQIIRR